MSKNMRMIAMFTLLCFCWTILLPGLLPAQTTTNLDEARRLYKEGRLDKARAALDKLINEWTGKTDMEQSLADAYFLRAKIFIDVLENAKCEADLQALFNVAPDYPFPDSDPEFKDMADKIRTKITQEQQRRIAARLGIEMVAIRGGTFQMGSNSSEAYAWEKPVHAVTMSAFFMGKTEVTQGQWKAIMGSNPSKFQNGDNYPVEQVSWDDCQEFIRKLNDKTGKHYRLPTEAEWEYACRAGTTDDRYGDVDAIAWYDGNSGKKTHPVGQKQPNAWGLYDMLGNVWEWCSDWYGNYKGSAQVNPTGPASGSDRVVRGGSWGFDARGARAPGHGGYKADDRGGGLGFRLASN